MKKHLVIKACVLLVVMFFHSFVLVPKSYANTFEGVVGRIALRAIAPSAYAAMAAGSAAIIGVGLGVGIGYIIIKSGGITAIKNWLTNYGVPQAPPSGTTEANSTAWVGSNGWSGKVWNRGTWPPWQWKCYNADGVLQVGSVAETEAGAWAQVYSYLGGAYVPAYPTVPTDYSVALGSNQPDFGTGQLYATPGAAAALLGGAAIVSAVTMSDGDADTFKVGAGATAVSDAGVQEGSPPSTTDNAVTAGDTATIGILQQIANYVSNLIGIKTSVDATKVSIDCVAVLSSAQTVAISAQGAKLDNIASITTGSLARLDNIASITSGSLARLDNIASITSGSLARLDNIASLTASQTADIAATKTAVQQIDNTLTQSVATPSTISTRIDALKTAASTKFPFALATAISVTGVSGGGTYAFASLPLTPSISIPIDPLAGPLGDFFIWVRSILVWLLWVGTIFAILRDGMAL